MRLLILLFIFFLSANGCIENTQEEQDLCFIDVSIVNDKIAFPHQPISVCKMLESTPWIWSLSFFGDNGSCKHFSYNQDTILPRRAYYDSSHTRTGLALIVDTTQSYGMPTESYYIRGNLHLDEDYHRAGKVNHPEKYPPISTVAFYIINRQTYGVPLTMSSYIPLLIQEAMDTSGRWKPIEHIGILGCGNSDHETKLPPNSYLTGSILKYTGNYETQLRLKLRTGEHILYSTPYKGSINLEQFEITEWHKELMEKEQYGSGIFESLFLHPRRVCKEYW